MDKYVGLSLAGCVNDMVEYGITPAQIEKIISAVGPDADWNEVFSDYRRFEWTDHPDQCVEIARTLIADGKVDRVGPDNHPYPNTVLGYWQIDGKQADLPDVS